MRLIRVWVLVFLLGIVFNSVGFAAYLVTISGSGVFYLVADGGATYDAVKVDTGSSAELRQCSLYSGATYSLYVNENCTLNNSVLWGAGYVNTGKTLTGSHNIYQSFAGSGTNSLTSSATTSSCPFYSCTTGDLRLRSGSPAIDYGVTIDGYTTDIRGRSVYYGTAPDSGAYESKKFIIPISQFDFFFPFRP